MIYIFQLRKMIITKVLTTEIDTRDPSVLYSSDLNADLLRLLAEKFEGRCFKSCFVKKINKILQHSPMILDYHRTEGSGKISIEFEITGVVYDADEVIPEASIIQILENGSMVLKTPETTIMVAPNTKLQRWKTGDTVPVRVLKSKYKPGYKTIAISAIPFTKPVLKVDDMPVFVYFGEETKALDAEIAKVVKQIEEMKTQKFEKLLYETVKPPPTSAGETLKLLSFKDLKPMKEYMVWRHSIMNPKNLEIYAVEIKSDAKNLKPSQEIIVGLKTQLLKDLLTLASLAQAYKGDEHWTQIF
jgi:hypothetical protein